MCKLWYHAFVCGCAFVILQEDRCPKAKAISGPCTIESYLECPDVQFVEGSWYPRDIYDNPIWHAIYEANYIDRQTIGFSPYFIVLKSKSCQFPDHLRMAREYSMKLGSKTGYWEQLRQMSIQIVQRSGLGNGTRGYNPQTGEVEDHGISREY
ncbi:hypothetical protein BT63DRAFT_461354 [Microthyrium microscopicum]|uniref:Uncharacterized protein n=1 Tax=Microthyrium microscopicum TaxID=703497 RepID=A0A6A6TTU0_9PEZI|nr:hypothetical protein BT63DRAFT_461354 [Microthyrium microscopicum]